MSSAVADRTLAQIEPRALAILGEAGFDVPPGKRRDGSPEFRGIPPETWKDLEARPALLEELTEICRRDFPTFCALMLKVVSKGGAGTHPLIYNNGQTLLWRRLVERLIARLPLFFIILKARQLGITTFMAAWQFWHLWRLNDIQTLMIAHEVKLSERIVSIMRVFYDYLPDIDWIKPTLRADAGKTRKSTLPRGELYFQDRRSWGVTAVAKNLEQRGFQGTHFSGSEGAFWPDMDSLLDALLPQLPPPGSDAYLSCSFVLESSPNGQNAFYERYQIAKDPKSEWCAVFLPWMVQDDEYVMTPPREWRMTKEEKSLQKRLSIERRKIDGKDVSAEQMYFRHYMLLNKYGGNEEAWDKEFPSDDETCFLLMTRSVFKDSMRYLTACCQEAERRAVDAWKASRYKVEARGPVVGRLEFESLPGPFSPRKIVNVKAPSFKPSPSGYLWVWEPPEPEHLYVIGADPAGGNAGNDNSVGFVLDVTTGRQVAEIVGAIYPEDFADILVHTGMWYNRALINPEMNTFGAVVLKRMKVDWGYDSIAREEKWDEVGLKRNKFGVYMNEQQKGAVIATALYMVEEEFVAISSRQLLQEMSIFEYDQLHDTYGAKGRGHDDCVMAFALALYAVRQSPKLFSAMTANKQKVPTARDLGLSAAPRVAEPKVPAEFLKRADEPAYWNPIRPAIGGFEF